MNSCTPVRVMVVAGGSAGHILPAVGFCQELLEKSGTGVRITFVTTATPLARSCVTAELHPVYCDIRRTPWGVLKLLVLTLFYMGNIRPRIVLGFGGYLSVPFVVSAKLGGRRTLIHEQNVIPGRANRFLGAFADLIAVSFAQTQKYFKQKKKVFLCRYPLRRSLIPEDKNTALNFFGFQDSLFTILVVGGSQGARSLNARVLETLKISRNLHRFQILHLTGSADFSAVSEAYQRLAVHSKVFAFLNEMHYAYSACDLVISRSGAGAVWEIARFGRPSILVPYAHAGGHQKENARVLAETGASLLLEEEKLTASMLSQLLDIFLDDHIRRKTMGALATSFYEAAQKRDLCDCLMA